MDKTYICFLFEKLLVTHEQPTKKSEMIQVGGIKKVEENPKLH